MSTTTYYNISLISENNQDWGNLLNQILSKLTEIIARNQKPAGVALQWGDISNNKYLTCTDQGLKVVGGIDLGLGQTRNLVVEGGTAFPGSSAEGQFFLRTDEGTLYIHIGGSWTAISALSSASIQSAGGLVVGDVGTGVADTGNILIADGAGEVDTLRPSEHENGILIADPNEVTGWRWAPVEAELARRLFSERGQLFIGSGAESGQVVSLPAGDPDNRLLFSDTGQASGVAWVTVTDALAKAYDVKGRLFVGSGPQTMAQVDAPTEGQVLIGDPAEAGGIRWANQSELGSIPGSHTSAYANLFAVNNFI